MSAACEVCERQPTFQVGPDWRSCDKCLSIVVRAAHAAGDGFAPPLVYPLRERTTGRAS